LFHLLGVEPGSEQHLLVSGLYFQLEDILSSKIIETLFILVDLNLNFDALRVVMALQLAPLALDSI